MFSICNNILNILLIRWNNIFNTVCYIFYKDIPTEVLVINKFEGEKTSQELANKYAVEKDHFEGKLGHTYLLHTLGQTNADKILVIGFGKKEEFNANKMREAVAKAVKKLQQIKAKKAVFVLTTNE